MKIDFEKFKQLQKEDWSYHNFYGRDSLAAFYYRKETDEESNDFVKEEYTVSSLARGFIEKDKYKHEFLIEQSIKAGEHSKKPMYLDVYISPENISANVSTFRAKALATDKAKIFVEATAIVMNSIYEYLLKYGCLITETEDNTDFSSEDNEDAETV